MDRESVSLTAAEWRVMECLWQEAPLSGKQAAARLRESAGWSRSTTLTLLRRLEEKGAVAGDAANGVKAFRPLLARTDAARQETESLLERAYQGSLSLLVSAMTQRQPLPQAEIDELYAILRDMEGQAHA